jgi:hypothetical protein
LYAERRPQLLIYPFSPKPPSWIYPSPLWKINRVKAGQKKTEKMQAIPRSEDGELRRT